MGFPIRKSADQSLFAAPHGLSQRTTSFIASQRQGIHRILLRHLIALIIDAHRSAAASTHCMSNGFDRKTSLLQTHPGAPRSSRAHCDWCSSLVKATDKPRKAVRCARATKVDRIRFLFTMSDNPQALARSRNSLWTLLSQGWAGCRDPASGGARRDRTDDLMLAKHALSQLSYGPEASRRIG